MSIVESSGRIESSIATPWRNGFNSTPVNDALFLVSGSQTPCGVESFARRTARHWRQLGLTQATLVVTGRPADLLAVWRGLAQAESLVINFPVVAWKKMLFTPLLAFIIALLHGRKTVAVIHEWHDLDWRRRIFVGLYALFARSIVFSSPMVREQFRASPVARLCTSEISVTTIPANIDRAPHVAPTALSERLAALRASGKFVIAHFGSIYPKKQSDFVLDVAARMKREGKDVALVFVGSFVKGCDNVEARFMEKLKTLGLENDISVTGYIESDADVFSLFDQVDCFLYRFADGLSSRRSSVLASLQSGKPVIVNAPDTIDEFSHHRIFRTFLERGKLLLVSRNADAQEYVESIAAVASVGGERLEDTPFREAWRDTVRAIAAATDPALARSSVFTERRRAPRAATA